MVAATDGATVGAGVPAAVKPGDLLASAALSVASLVVLIGALEAGVRIFVPEQRWRFLDATEDWQLDPELGWVNRPNLDVQSRYSGPEAIRFRTNPDGLIPAEARAERPPGAFRVMIFGDSMVVGRTLPSEQVYPARIEAILRERGVPAQVINAGVLGYSTDQVLIAMQRWLPIYHPDVALYGSTFNDLGGNALENAYQQAKPRFELDARGELHRIPPRLAASIHRFDGGFAVWIQHSGLYRLLQPLLFQLRARFLGFDDRALLGIYEEAYVDPRFADRFDWRLYGALVGAMRDASAAAGARFAFFAHPEVSEVWDPFIERVCTRLGVARSAYDPHAMERRVLEVATAQRVEFVPLIEEFRAHPERGPFHILPSDPHLSAAGHELLAELLSARLLADRAN